MTTTIAGEPQNPDRGALSYSSSGAEETPAILKMAEREDWALFGRSRGSAKKRAFPR
jgi:hypothetical protein